MFKKAEPLEKICQKESSKGEEKSAGTPGSLLYQVGGLCYNKLVIAYSVIRCCSQSEVPAYYTIGPFVSQKEGR